MDQDDRKIHDPNPGPLDRPGVGQKVIWGLVALCALLFAADAFYTKYGHFEIETLFGFYPTFAFVMCILVVAVARLMRAFLKRDEGYYDSDG